MCGTAGCNDCVQDDDEVGNASTQGVTVYVYIKLYVCKYAFGYE